MDGSISLHKKTLISAWIFYAFFQHYAYGAEEAANTENLEDVQVKAQRQGVQSLPFSGSRKASDVVIGKEKLQARSASLGNALAGEPGIHSNPFGGGASAPIIRGQEGVRIKILQNGSDVVDMSSLSPDHVVAADTLLAQQVELVRGTPTLMYSTASPAGVVNIVDGRIPQTMPAKGITGAAAARFDTASDEKVGNAAFTLGLGRHFALRAEGLARKANSYSVPAIKLNENLDYVPDTHNKSRVGTLGFSWIGKKGYLGAAYSYRKDRYGIPGHNHALDTCSMHFVETGLDADSQSHHYLDFYPHLYDEKTMIKSVHPHCGVEHGGVPHSHEHPYGHEHIHSGGSGGPYIQMHSRRVDIQGEWRQPFSGLEKIKISLAKARYYHDEWHDGKLFAADKDLSQYEKNQAELAAQKAGKAESAFSNKGFNARLELYHQKIGGLSGVWGVQYQTQKTYAERFFEKNKIQDRYGLVPNTNKQFSLFAIEQFKWRNFTFEAGARWEKQRIPIDYDRQAVQAHLAQKACRMPLFSNKKVSAEMIEREACESAGGRYSLRRRGKLPDYTAYRENALSYSGSLLWDFHPDYRLSATVSHNERLPTVMELYYHGKHLATNSFEYGNKNLKPEKSDNFELGLSHASEKWRYRISAYHNRFDNYIHSENVFRSGNLYARRYNQSQARFHGVEGEISFLPAPDYSITLFGDYVRGRLKKLPAIYDHIPTYADNADGTPCESDCTIAGYESVHVPDRNAARVPPARLGLRLTGRFNPHWDGSLEYTRVFTQNKNSVSVFSKRKSQEKNGSRLESVRVYEDKTPGYHLINGSLSYRNKTHGINYQLALYANNLLDEKIYVHTSFLPYVPQMGRNFIVQFNAEF